MSKKLNKKVLFGIVDANLLDNGTRHPNLVLMKIAGYLRDHKQSYKFIINGANENLKDYSYIVTIRPNASCRQILHDLSLLKKYEKIFITHDRDPISRDLF